MWLNDLLCNAGDYMNTNIKDIGQYLEAKAKVGTPITYGQIIKRFPDLPPLAHAGRATHSAPFLANSTVRII